MAVVKTAGTSLFFVKTDPTVALVEVGCISSLSGGDITTTQIETTCLNDNVQKFVAGIKQPGTYTFSVYFDDEDSSLKELRELHNSGETVDWAIGYGLSKNQDIEILPSVDSDGLMSNPGGRNFDFFSGYVASYSTTFEQNSVVTVSLSIQISGAVVSSYYNE